MKEIRQELREALEDPEAFLARHPWFTKKIADTLRKMAARYKRRHGR